MEIEAAKIELRAQMRVAFQADARAASSSALCDRLRNLPEWKAATTVMAFAPMGDEPDIEPLLCRSLATALPRWCDGTYEPAEILDLNGLEAGHFGVKEPGNSCRTLHWHEIDLMLVPGLAFDLNGNRLGRGGGFYDRLLKQARAAGPLVAVGVCFEWQQVARVPTAPHDRPVDLVVSA
ncbi:MAG: 5-formyltetrahydrofolate cyclo-ligase [Verrucomicrobiales bacterium]|nr:5-formyltetrahydrofolate cyclo-ligase [Verrucomicrobiales bacterium]|tara:strand:- start:524 stop:1060 length:537 start_codon:yes stop_codon:yes gene_type:complete